MLALLALSFAAISPLDDDPAIDPLEVARANFSKLADFQFVFEGGFRVVDGPRRAPTAPPPLEEDYQGTYSFRSRDGATLLDVYHQLIHGNAPLRHTSQAILKTQLSMIDHTFDLDRKETPAAKGNGGPGSLNTISSPESFLFFWTLRVLLLDPKGWGYEDQGREDVDGRSCRKVQFDELYGYKLPDRPVVRYWLDLGRGGIPLKVEYERQGIVKRRTTGIRIDPVRTSDGQEAFFPIAGTTFFFSREVGDVAGQSRVRETCTVVPSSLRINQNLDDSVFSVRKDAPGLETPGLRDTRLKFDQAAKHPPTRRGFRTDPAGVRDNLAKNLAEADRQAGQLEASSVARDASRWGLTWPVAISLASAVVIVGGLSMRRWRR